MAQKQIIGLLLGLLGLGLAAAFAYWQFAAPVPRGGTLSMEGQSKADVSKQEPRPAEPETIDAMSLSIQEETAADLSALDDEANGEILEMEADSDSVTDLGTSYDENSF